MPVSLCFLPNWKAQTWSSLTGKKNQNVFFSRENNWGVKMDFILVILRWWPGKEEEFSCYDLTVSWSLILEKTESHFFASHFCACFIYANPA